jgi:PD-(D/E)XK nuclease superfamily
MRIDNTAFSLYMRCPKLYLERYEAKDFLGLPELRHADVPRAPEAGATAALRPGDHDSSDGGHSAGQLPSILQPGIERIPDPTGSTGRAFGKRFHELLENRHRAQLGLEPKVYPKLSDLRLESEAQSVFAQYEQHWLGDELQTLGAEAQYTLPLPGSAHELTVRIDRIVRFPDGTVGPQDSKTESTPGNNSRENWSGRTQASLYLWALEQLQPQERVSRLVVDVITRGNSKRAPIFYRSDDITRSPADCADAIRNVIRVADEIEHWRAINWWPSNMNICKDGWRKCDYYELHVLGRTDANLRLYQPSEQYLDV